MARFDVLCLIGKLELVLSPCGTCTYLQRETLQSSKIKKCVKGAYSKTIRNISLLISNILYTKNMSQNHYSYPLILCLFTWKEL